MIYLPVRLVSYSFLLLVLLVQSPCVITQKPSTFTIANEGHDFKNQKEAKSPSKLKNEGKQLSPLTLFERQVELTGLQFRMK